MSAGAPRVALVNLGCRVNRAELDVMAGELRRRGYALAPEADADAVVVNTCAVTGEAEAKARKAVRHAASLPQAPCVVATGCVASLFADELAALGPDVTVEPRKDRVPDLVAGLLGERGLTPGEPGAFEDGATPTGRRRPGVKVQDGCDNRCTYCIVWKARGPARSLPLARCVEQVRAEAAQGAAEVVLTGINLGRYQDGAAGLPELLEALLESTDVGRLRLGSVEPPEVTDRLLQVMAQSQGRVAPFLHLPLQSGSERVLRAMGRLYTAEAYREVVGRVREALPGAAVACDVIAGFPGETEAEFAEGLAFCGDMAFSNMHVFRYSRRPGTPAAADPAQLSPAVIAARAASLRQVAARGREDYARSLVGSPDLVLVEAPGSGVTGGLAQASVDEGLAVGSLVPVTVSGVLPGGALLCR